MNRNLDGVYFRIERDGSYHNICFSDLNEVERDRMLKDRSEEWLKNLCCILADVIKDIGDTFDIISEETGEDEE